MACLGVVLFVVGTTTQTGWLYLVDAGLVVLLALGWVGPRRALRALVVHRDCPPSTVEGEGVPVRLTVINPDGHPRWWVTVSDTPVGTRGGGLEARRFLVPEVPARGSVSVEYAMACPHRGAWRFKEIELASAFPLGFFPFRRLVASPSSAGIVVCPRAVPFEREGRHAHEAATRRESRAGRRRGHGHDFRGVRAYEPGDDTRYVHWPTSVRAGRLMVREFIEPVPEALVLLVDVAPPAWPGEEAAEILLDHAARVAAALVRQAWRRSAGLTLLAGEGRGVDVRVAPRLEGALEWLGGLRVHAAPPWPEVLRLAARTVPRLGGVLVITSETRVDVEAVRLAEAHGVRASVVLLDAGSLSGGIRPPEVPTVEDLATELRAFGGSVRVIRSLEGPLGDAPDREAGPA